MLATCCQFDSLENFDSDMIQAALSNPEDFCLKILREGGAEGNLFGEEILEKLGEMKRGMYRYAKPFSHDQMFKINVPKIFYFAN
jgi:hypothetical protein